MKNILSRTAILAILAGAASAAQALPGFPNIAIGATAGTLGAGAQATIEVLPFLNGRISAQGLGFSPSYHRDGVDYKGKLKLLTYGAYADIYPFTRFLRLSAGIVGNQNRLGLRAGCSDTCEVGDARVSNSSEGDNGLVSGRLDFKKVAPYAGIGFTNPMAGLPFYFGADFGVLFQGRPRVNLAGSGTATVDFQDGEGPQQVDLATSSQFQTQLASEQHDLADTTHKYRFYPVVQLNLGWRF